LNGTRGGFSKQETEGVVGSFLQFHSKVYDTILIAQFFKSNIIWLKNCITGYYINLIEHIHLLSHTNKCINYVIYYLKLV
jgi:hypothetical protein